MCLTLVIKLYLLFRSHVCTNSITKDTSNLSLSYNSGLCTRNLICSWGYCQYFTSTVPPVGLFSAYLTTLTAATYTSILYNTINMVTLVFTGEWCCHVLGIGTTIQSLVALFSCVLRKRYFKGTANYLWVISGQWNSLCRFSAGNSLVHSLASTTEHDWGEGYHWNWEVLRHNTWVHSEWMGKQLAGFSVKHCSVLLGDKASGTGVHWEGRGCNVTNSLGRWKRHQLPARCSSEYTQALDFLHNTHLLNLTGLVSDSTYGTPGEVFSFTTTVADFMSLVICGTLYNCCPWTF